MKSGYWTREFIAGLFHLITPYWNSEEKKSARLYLAGIITLTIAAVYMTLLLNEWFNSFYSALQNYDSGAVYRGLLRFTGLAFAHIAFAVYSYYLQQRLALRWRKWMTKNYLPNGPDGRCTTALKCFPKARQTIPTSVFPKTSIFLRHARFPS